MQSCAPWRRTECNAMQRLQCAAPIGTPMPRRPTTTPVGAAIQLAACTSIEALLRDPAVWRELSRERECDGPSAVEPWQRCAARARHAAESASPVAVENEYAIAFSLSAPGIRQSSS
eukprot:4052542-Prymnesium_polylepis.1